MSRRVTRSDHLRFCHVDCWQEVRNARGGAVRHHATYELALDDGRILRTRISRPVGREEYGDRLWHHILTDQLQVSAAEFWACIDDSVRPRRGGPAPPAAEVLPASLVHQLLHVVGLDERDVAAMTREQAIARMNEHWSQQPPG